MQELARLFRRGACVAGMQWLTESQMESTPPPQSRTETRPAGGLRMHEPPWRPSSLPGDSGGAGFKYSPPPTPPPKRSLFALCWVSLRHSQTVIGTPPVWTLDICLECRHGPSRGDGFSLIVHATD